MSVTGSIMAGVGAAGSLGGALIGSSAAGHAADTQAGAAEQAAQLQHEDAQDALNFQKEIFGIQQNNIAPWLSVGRSGLANLANLLGILPPSSSTSSNGMNFGSPSFAVPRAGGSTGAPGSIDGSVRPGMNLGNDANLMPLLSDGSGGNMFSARGGTVPMSSLLPNRINGVQPSTSGFQPFPGPPDTSFGNGTLTVPNASASAGNGTVDLNSLVNPNLGAAGSLLAQFPGGPFVAPTDVTEQNDPGFKFRLDQGTEALENSAAARGGLLSGNEATALTKFGQDYGSNEYSNVYNRKLTEYQQAYNQFQQQQANTFNRLADIAGLGQVSAGQLNSAAANAGNSVSSILLNSGQQIGSDLQNAGAARASGYVGSANAINGGISSLSNLASLLPFYSMFGGGGGGGTGGGGVNIDPGSIGFCWIAEELYGVDSPKTHMVRAWLKEVYSHDPIGRHFVALYAQHGERIAKAMKNDSELRKSIEPLFDAFADQARAYGYGENFESVRYQR